MDKLKFINSIKAGAIDGQKKFNILASVTIAQAILESGWGRAIKGNNVFGIKWTVGCGHEKQIFRTCEFEKGKRVSYDLAFRKYNTIAESILDHTELLTKPRYKPVRDSKTYKGQCMQLQKCGYATSPTYGVNLIAVIESNKLWQYDKIISKPVTK